jgi:sugar O-acyltransferase (sialic acid O-acetyltransferase NeuD family)
MNLPAIVIGGGGHAKVLINALLLAHREVLGYVDLDSALAPVLGVSCLGDDSAIFRHAPDTLRLVNGVGSAGSTAVRRRIFERFQEKQYAFATVIHPSAIIAPDVRIDEGAQVMAGAIVQSGSSLGANSILNTGACVDHDCIIGAHAHIAPGVTLSGNVRIGQGAHVGTGACIIQGIVIGADSLVAAGAVVVDNVPAGVTVAGVPARPSVKKPVLD